MREEFIADNFNGHRMATSIRSLRLHRWLRPQQPAVSRSHRGNPGPAAYRQVDRRLVYIDPDPTPLATMSRQTVPGFFSTLRGAMSDIPRTQPVTEELSWVSEFNEQVSRIREHRRKRAPAGAANSSIKTIAEPLDRPISPEELRQWREKVNTHVVTDAGFAYEGYVRLKLASVRDFLVSIIVKLRDVPERSPLAHAIAIVIERWTDAARLDVQQAGRASPLKRRDSPSVAALGGVSAGVRRQVSRAPAAIS